MLKEEDKKKIVDMISEAVIANCPQDISELPYSVVSDMVTAIIDSIEVEVDNIVYEKDKSGTVTKSKYRYHRWWE
jgi:hypothetical protein